jgi:hypothetical protein
MLVTVDEEKIALNLLLLSNLKAKRAVTETLTLYTYKSISDFFLQIPMHEERKCGLWWHNNIPITLVHVILF